MHLSCACADDLSVKHMLLEHEKACSALLKTFDWLQHVHSERARHLCSKAFLLGTLYHSSYSQSLCPMEAVAYLLPCPMVAVAYGSCSLSPTMSHGSCSLSPTISHGSCSLSPTMSYCSCSLSPTMSRGSCSQPPTVFHGSCSLW